MEITTHRFHLKVAYNIYHTTMEGDAVLDDLRKRAADKYSTNEIESFINMGKRLAGKAVLTAVLDVISEGPSQGHNKETALKLIKKISKLIPYKDCGSVSCSFSETPLILHISLTRVPKDYEPHVDLPDMNYAKDLFKQYDFLKALAVAYWQQFGEEYPRVRSLIAKYRPDVDFSTIVVDKDKPTTLYFDPACTHRVGIFCYYTDEQNRIYYRKQENKEVLDSMGMGNIPSSLE